MGLGGNVFGLGLGSAYEAALSDGVLRIVLGHRGGFRLLRARTDGQPEKSAARHVPLTPNGQIQRG